MKSLFKRTFAAATGSVLALSQLAAMAATVNISAAETGATSSVTTIDKDYVLNIPVIEADPFQITASDWNDRVETEVMAAGTKVSSVHAGKLRESIIKRVKDVTFHLGSVSDEQAKKLDACFSDAGVTVTEDGKFAAVVRMEDIAPIIGEIYMDTLKRTDAAAADDGTALEPDFSGIKISGVFTLRGNIDFDKKIVTTSLSFTEDDSTTYTDFDDMFSIDAESDLGYIPGKMFSFIAATDAAAEKLSKAGHKIDNYSYWAGEFADHVGNFATDAQKAADAVQSISVEGADLDTVLGQYKEQLKTKLDNSKLASENKKRIDKQIDYYAPGTEKQLFESERANSLYDTFTETFNKSFERAEYVLTLADIQGVIDSAISEEYAFTNGYSFNAKVKIDDDQKDELLTELIASGMTAKDVEDKYGYTVIIDGDETGIDKADLNTYEYVAVDSIKTILFNDITNDYGINTEFFYDVLRDVQAVHIKAKTVTTTTTTTTDITTTTTSDDKQGGSTTTTSEEGQQGGSTTTTSEEGQGGSTTTTSDGGQQGGSTTTTTSDGGQQGGSTTTTTSDGGQQGGSTTTTTYVNYVAFDIEGFGDEGLVYWSEETTPFDLSKLSVTLRIYEEGVDTGKTVDVSSAFQASATDPTQCEKPDGIGIAATPIAYKLVDAETVQKAILDAGYDQETIEANGIKEGMEVSDLIVYLVNRGDTDLNGSIGAADAQDTLVYYTATLVANKTAKKLLEDPEETYLKTKGDLAEKYLPFSHYAADAANGDGKITAEDAQAILSYYTYWVVANHSGEWSWVNDEIPVQGHTPLDELHAKPLSKDKYCEDIPDLFDKSLAG